MYTYIYIYVHIIYIYIWVFVVGNVCSFNSLKVWMFTWLHFLAIRHVYRYMCMLQVFTQDQLTIQDEWNIGKVLGKANIYIYRRTCWYRYLLLVPQCICKIIFMYRIYLFLIWNIPLYTILQFADVNTVSPCENRKAWCQDTVFAAYEA